MTIHLHKTNPFMGEKDTIQYSSIYSYQRISFQIIYYLSNHTFTSKGKQKERAEAEIPFIINIGNGWNQKALLGFKKCDCIDMYIYMYLAWVFESDAMHIHSYVGFVVYQAGKQGCCLVHVINKELVQLCWKMNCNWGLLILRKCAYWSHNHSNSKYKMNTFSPEMGTKITKLNLIRYSKEI